MKRRGKTVVLKINAANTRKAKRVIASIRHSRPCLMLRLPSWHYGYRVEIEDASVGEKS
jgi:hypothetical protein